VVLHVIVDDVSINIKNRNVGRRFLRCCGYAGAMFAILLRSPRRSDRVGRRENAALVWQGYYIGVGMCVLNECNMILHRLNKHMTIILGDILVYNQSRDFSWRNNNYLLIYQLKLKWYRFNELSCLIRYKGKGGVWHSMNRK
jgi:hypothetical protein